MRHTAGIGFGDGRRQGASLSLGFVVIDAGKRMRHEQDIARCAPVCTRAVSFGPGLRQRCIQATAATGQDS